ncbi:hypothetical protein PQQ53_21315 [Paraburkholderia strydomiana]|uniref:hypothetical protein n=1 Tax=Paraburkholderia strydomiana TaxID=1245417 RepID=UPI0038B850D5
MIEQAARRISQQETKGFRMTPAERINAIEQAGTYDEINDAMAGYYEDAVVTHTELANCYPLKVCIEGGTFEHALIDLEEFAKKTSGDYPDVKQILTVAAIKQRSLRG